MPKTWIVLLVCTVVAGGALSADDYPAKPVRFVVPWPAGGIADSRSRIMAQCVAQSWGQSVVVDNKPGASGIIGVDLVAKAAPDGYTLAFVSANDQAIAQAMGMAVPYDAEKDLSPIIQFTRTPIVLVAAPGIKVDDAKALVAWAKANKGLVSYGSPGVAHTNHFAAEEFNRVAGILATHVAYKGEAAMLPDIIAGRVAYGFAYAGTIEPMVRAGKLKALLVTGRVRSPQLPEVPTAAEAGYPEADTDSWGGLAGPAGLTREVVERINLEWAKCLKSPQLQARREFLDAQIIAGTAQEFAQFMRAERVRWAKLVKLTGIKPE
jgi:tripartite-type tricarboxylate transporter receptor subunit TctC